MEIKMQLLSSGDKAGSINNFLNHNYQTFPPLTQEVSRRLKTSEVLSAKFPVDMRGRDNNVMKVSILSKPKCCSFEV